MQSLKYTLILLMVISIGANATAYSSTPTEQEPMHITDTRLAQKVTYRVKAKTVEKILDDLSTLTGVTLKAGYNDLDWQVRDRKMIIAVKDVPLGTLMNSIARTMKFKWSKNTKVDPPTYRLYMDRHLLLEANHLMQKQLDSIRQEIDEKREHELARLLSLADASTDQLEKVKYENPRMYLYARSGAAKSLSALMNAAPDLYTALLSGQELEVSADSLTPDGQQALLQMVENLAKPDGILLLPHPNQPLIVDSALQIEQVKIQINSGLSQSLSNPFASRLELGSFGVQFKGMRSGIALLNPDSSHMINEKMRLKMAEESIHDKDAWAAFENEYQQTRVDETKSDPSGEALIEHTEDPDLEVKVKLEPKEHRLVDYLIALGEATDFSIVSDWYGVWPESIDLPKNGEKLRSILDKIQDRYRYNWDRNGSILEFRDRCWYWKRAAQIPEAWLEDWRETLKKTGTLDLDRLVQVSHLTAEQYQFNIPGDVLFAGDIARSLGAFCDFGIYGPIIQVFGNLNTNERKMLFTGGSELWVSSLSQNAQESVDKLLLRNKADYLEEPRPEIKLMATRRKVGKQFEYTFRLTPDSDLEPVEVKFTTPKYEPKVTRPAYKDKIAPSTAAGSIAI